MSVTKSADRATLPDLLPVITSNWRGSDLMVPIAIPIFGGMLIELMTMFVVPVLYCIKEAAASSAISGFHQPDSGAA